MPDFYDDEMHKRERDTMSTYHSVSVQELCDTTLAREGQPLLSHLKGVARLAQRFAAKVGLGYIVYVCGILHDLGKYSKAFQCYLAHSLAGRSTHRGDVPHSWEGAFVVLEHFGNDSNTTGLADILANIIASHHSGLTDMIIDAERAIPSRVDSHAKAHEDQFRDIVDSQEAATLLAGLDWNAVKEEFHALRQVIGKSPFALHLAVKFIYSCLVDADRCNAAGINCVDESPDWNAMERCLNARLAKFAEATEKNRSPLDDVRASISNQCAEQAVRAPGVFTLSVPTGGGKTLSSLRFAIRHARTNGLKRIVYVIPYLSINDQTAHEFRNVFGDRADDWLLEHHSNFLLDSENEDDEKRYDLGTQRWEAPVIVTTMVQFLESVMSNKASDLRKFHNMAKAVFIFDEVQALPVACTHLFNCIVNFLCEFGGVTSVLCSATQPALAKTERSIHLSANPDLVSLAPETRLLFRRTWFHDMTSPELTCEEIAQLAISRYRTGKNTLVVMNTKTEARKVFAALSEAHKRYFLSTDMCPAHRLDILQVMREALSPAPGAKATPILCVSTQLIEAGVDISFDCVIRSEAGFDSIVQVAGRCNRHGRSSTPQEVIIVRVKDEKLESLDEIALGKELTARLRREKLLGDEVTALDTYYAYKFGNNEQKRLMDYPIEKPKKPTDQPPTLYDLLGANRRARAAYADAHGCRPYPGLHSAFQSAAEHFAVIPGVHIGVVVPYAKSGAPDEVQSLVSDFLATGERLRSTFDREARAAIYRERSRILRRLQQYTVSVYPSREAAIQQMASRIDDAFYLLSPDHYDPVIGLTDEQGFLDG